MSNVHGALKLRDERRKTAKNSQVLSPRYFSRPWSTYELSTLKKSAGMGAEALADLLGRSVGSVKRAAQRNRISLRTPGTRTGLVMGQPREVSFKSCQIAGVVSKVLWALREAQLAGEADVRRLEEIASRAAKLAQGAPLCPACTCRPQEVESTGLCRDCHLKELAAAHEHEENDEAQRLLWSARQAKVRRRRREAQEETPA